MKKFQSFICIMLSGLLLVSSLSGFGMSVQATENATVDIPKYSDVDEYEVIMNDSAKVFVSHSEPVDFSVGDKYYLTYTVESIEINEKETTLRTGVATTCDKRSEYPYETGFFRYIDKTSDNQAESITEAGSTYTFCVEVAENGTINYTVSKDTETSAIMVGDLGKNTSKATTHFGLWISAGITGKLTNVKCYDAEGNDLGVWGNKTYGVTVFEETTEYEVLINNTTPMSVLSAKELAFAVGDKYYMSYTRCVL